MVIDKDSILAITFAVLAVAFLSLFIFAPGDEMPDEFARPDYAADDIRYSMQQDEKKHPKKKQAAVPESFVTDGSTSAGGSDGSIDDSDDGANEEPDISDHEPQEEPEIE